MKKSLIITAAAVVVAGLASAPQVEASAWAKCQVCHNFTPENKSGPGLGMGMVEGKSEPGVYMRDAGTHPGFKYKFARYIPDGKAWKWDEAHLRKWMCNSKDAVKEFTGDSKARSGMPPQHVCDKAEQDEVLAKMKEISGDT